MTRKRALLLSILLLAGSALLMMDPRGFRRTGRLKDDLQQLETTNASLRVENERLRRELSALADDPAALERAAREELGLVRPGEVVFRLEDGDGAHAP
jgi:cell division protein FtsB